MSRDPKKLHYASSHEWLDFDSSQSDGVATIGISKFAVTQLNDLVYMELPKVGQTVTAGGEFGEVESVKSVNSLFSPVSGEVVEVHEALPDSLDKLGDDPYDFGWIIKVKVEGDVPPSLMNFDDYEKQCAEEG